MSVDLSVSGNGNIGCSKIIGTLRALGIDCRTIETRSVIQGNVEDGCLVTLGSEYGNKQRLRELWNHIRGDYECAFISINGRFSGCIYNFIDSDLCPFNKTREVQQIKHTEHGGL